MKKKILAVDDDPLVLKSLKRWFHEYDWTLSSNAKNALELVQKSEYDLVLTDVRMPEMDGVEFLKCLVSMEEQDLSRIPCEKVILTGYDDRSAVEACHEKIKAYRVEKPLGESLGITLRRALENREKRRLSHTKNEVLCDLAAELEMLLEGLSACVPLPVFITDSQGQIEMINEACARQIGLKRNEIQGSPLHRFVGGLEWLYLMESWEDAVLDAELKRLPEAKLLPTKGKVIPCRVYWQKVKNRRTDWNGLALCMEKV